MTHINPLSTDETKRKNNALRITVIILGASLIAFIFNTILALQVKSWHIYSFTVLVFIIGLIAFNALRHIRNGHTEKGMTQIIIGIMVILPPGTLLVSGVGVIVGLIIVMTSYIYASQTLPAKSVRRIVIASLVVGALTSLTDLLRLEYRMQVPQIQTFAPAITGLVLVFIGAFIAYEAWGRSMLSKLMVALIGTTLITAGILSVYMFISTTNVLRQELERELGQHTYGVAKQISALFDKQVTSLTTLSLNETLRNAAEDANRSYEGDASSIQVTLRDRDEKWQAADAANSDDDPLVQQSLHNPASQQLIQYRNAFPNHVELFITDVYGGLVATSSRTSDYYQADEVWWQIAYGNGKGAIYISEPKYDQSTGIFAIQMAMPIRDPETTQLIGIIRTTYETSAITPILGAVVGETGETALYIPGRPAYIFHQGQLDPMDPDELNKLQELVGQGMVEMDYEDESATSNASISNAKVPSVVIQTSMKDLGEDTEFSKLGWVVLYHQSQDEAYAPIDAAIRGVVIVLAIVLFLAVAGAYTFSQVLVKPITQLTQAAEAVAAGNLDSRANVSSTDEVGALASTFNSMTSQLQETLQGLEHRVSARTRDLAIVAEVGTATATILESQTLLQEVVELTKERFHLYHSHIYLLDEKGENLVLTAGAGEPGRIMAAEGRSIPISREQSLVARAARDRKGVTVNDVTQDPDFLPNALLPDTRSELAVPMIVAGNVIGVFDIQSEQVGRFTESDVNIQTTLAAQLAVSVQNVRSFEQSRKQAELESLVNTIGQKIQRTTSIEETLQTAIRELGTAVGASRVKANISTSRDVSNN